MQPPVDTHCPYCALQCGMTLHPGEQGMSVMARDFPVNRGKLCPKGWTSTELLTHPERLRTPLVRGSKGGSLRPVSWEEALDRIAFAVRDIQQAHGWDAIGVLGAAA